MCRIEYTSPVQSLKKKRYLVTLSMAGKISSELRMHPYLLAVITLTCFDCVLETNGAEIPEQVSRRDSGDSIVISERPPFTCNVDDNLTYLVDERQCVRNQELLNGINKGLIHCLLLRHTCHVFNRLYLFNFSKRRTFKRHTYNDYH